MPNLSSPVPSGIAAVIATIFSSCFASSISASEKTAVYDGGAGFEDFLTSPETMSNGVTPCDQIGFDSAGLYPLPFFVMT